LHASSQVNYSRNPEAAQAAAERKTELDRAVTNAQATQKLAQEAKAATDKVATEATQAVARATEAQTKAPADAKAAADALKGAADEVKKLADAAKATADKSATDADANVKAATDAQAASAKLATDLANAAKPKNIAVGLASTAVVLRIAPAPIAINVFPPQGPAKPGAKVDVPVVVTRLFGFADAVQLSAALPQGVPGFAAPAVTVAAGQAYAILSINLGADAPPGQHTIPVQVTAKFAGQDMVASQAIVLTIEK
jgi:hypothetical protein